jgi:hypothetical protein
MRNNPGITLRESPVPANAEAGTVKVPPALQDGEVFALTNAKEHTGLRR